MRSGLLLALLLCAGTSTAQNTEADSIKRRLDTAQDEHSRVVLLEGLSYAYLSSDPDSALQFATEGLELARAHNDKQGEAICINAVGNVYFHIGDNTRALEMYLEYLRLKESFKNHTGLAVAYYNIASTYTETGDFPLALEYLQKAWKVDERSKDSSAILYDLYSLGSIYARMGKGDSSLYYLRQAYALADQLKDRDMAGAILNTYGAAYFLLRQDSLAAQYYRISNPYAEAVRDQEVVTSNYFGLAKIFDRHRQRDSAVIYARKALSIAQAAPFMKQVVEISEFLMNQFKARKQYDSAFYYLQLTTATRDSLFSTEQVKKVYNLRIEEQQRQQALLTARTKFRNQVKSAIGIVVLAFLLIVAIILWRNNRQKRTANELLRQQKQKAETALSELKSAQAQLIQSEKMASLGQVTAGVAHEIQNPLNFINNFSEVNTEILTDMQGEAARGNLDAVKLLAQDLMENEKRILHHGKRADAIVKNMLQHSRTSSGQREETDINALANEYMRLSFHGFRAKNKTFNASMHTDFDETIGKIEVVPQDFGRVFLNLFNNAFYAVGEKARQGLSYYEPSVSVRTDRKGKLVEIIIDDNGNGIDQTHLDKIFQPFFTTKPPGEGTGLGLSMTYDIIKAHGGEIGVDTRPGEGTRLTITIPV